MRLERIIMKYIRTKSGKIEEHWNTGGDLDNETHKSLLNFVQDNIEIVKVADTIEELCDLFVMFCPNAHRRKIRVYETMYSISLYFKRDKRWNGNMVDKVYGAIWTDKGLIYVAKMNSKGELELL